MELKPINPSAPAEDQSPSTASAADLPDVNESGMERLRRRYEQLDEGEERFTIPTYGELVEGVGMVWPFQGRYRRLDPEVCRDIRNEAATPEEFNARILVESCIELGVVGEPTPEEPQGAFEPLSNDPENPIRWDNRLLVGLGEKPVDAPGALIGREVLIKAFKGNWQAINEHSADVYGWMMYGRAVLMSGETKDGEKPGKA